MLSFDSVSHRGLRDVSFTVKAGELVGVLSRYRPERLTLLSLATKVEHPEHGTVRADGRVVVARRWWPQAAGRTIVGQLAFQLYASERSSTACRTRALELLSEWGLEDWSGRELDELEEYDLSRLALLVGIAAAPTVLLVDDPVAGADRIAESVRAMLASASTKGAAVLVTSPDLDPLRNVADLHTLNDGRLVSAPSADVLSFPAPCFD